MHNYNKLYTHNMYILLLLRLHDQVALRPRDKHKISIYVHSHYALKDASYIVVDHTPN